LSKVLLGIGSEHGRDPHAVAIDLLQVLSHLFKHASLANKMSVYFESDADQIPAKVNNLFSEILEQILRLTEDSRTMKPLNKACTETLGTFLGTLSLVDFIDTVEVLLGRSNDDLRRKVVKLTENRLDSAHVGDNASRAKALEFSSVLVNLLQTSPDILLKHAAVACIGKISEKFGKKDPAAIIAAAKVISSDRCIGQTDDRIRLMGVLCLASMAEVLGEGIVPVLPEVLPRSLDLLRLSLGKGKENPSLHDAVYSLISALLIHIPWMISDDYLDNILQLSFLSANRSLSEACDENRSEALQLLAKRLDAKETFDAIERNWPSAVEQGSKVLYPRSPIYRYLSRDADISPNQAVIEVLDITKAAIDKHPKSSTVKNVPVLMTLLRRAFDLRRIQTGNQTPAAFKADEIDDVEAHVNEVTIRMIYKLNDTLFRPLFTELTDWAVNDLGEKDKPGQVARMTSFFKFLETFFATLKVSISFYRSMPLCH
jgi:U3 small nucleolar RNA-associated protein 10